MVGTNHLCSSVVCFRASPSNKPHNQKYKCRACGPKKGGSRNHDAGESRFVGRSIVFRRQKHLGYDKTRDGHPFAHSLTEIRTKSARGVFLSLRQSISIKRSREKNTGEEKENRGSSHGSIHPRSVPGKGCAGCVAQRGWKRGEGHFLVGTGVGHLPETIGGSFHNCFVCPRLTSRPGRATPSVVR